MKQFCSQAYFETLFHDEHILGNILFTSCIVCYTYICFRLLMLKTIWCDFIIIFFNIEIWYWLIFTDSQHKSTFLLPCISMLLWYATVLFSSLNMNESTCNARSDWKSLSILFKLCLLCTCICFPYILTYVDNLSINQN